MAHGIIKLVGNSRLNWRRRNLGCKVESLKYIAGFSTNVLRSFWGAPRVSTEWHGGTWIPSGTANLEEEVLWHTTGSILRYSSASTSYSCCNQNSLTLTMASNCSTIVTVVSMYFIATLKEKVYFAINYKL